MITTAGIDSAQRSGTAGDADSTSAGATGGAMTRSNPSCWRVSASSSTPTPTPLVDGAQTLN